MASVLGTADDLDTESAWVESKDLKSANKSSSSQNEDIAQPTTNNSKERRTRVERQQRRRIREDKEETGMSKCNKTKRLKSGNRKTVPLINETAAHMRHQNQ